MVSTNRGLRAESVPVDSPDVTVVRVRSQGWSILAMTADVFVETARREMVRLVYQRHYYPTGRDAIMRSSSGGTFNQHDQSIGGWRPGRSLLAPGRRTAQGLVVDLIHDRAGFAKAAAGREARRHLRGECADSAIDLLLARPLFWPRLVAGWLGRRIQPGVRPPVE